MEIPSNSAQNTTAKEQVVRENISRKAAAGRIGAALVFVPILGGLFTLWAAMSYQYFFSHELLFDKPDMLQMRMASDAKHFFEGAVWGVLLLHAILLFLGWQMGRLSGVAVLHHQKKSPLRVSLQIYMAIFPTILLVLPVMIGFTEGLGELWRLFENYFDVGMQVGLVIAALSFLAALVLGFIQAFLLGRVAKKNGLQYVQLETESQTDDGPAIADNVMTDQTWS